VKIIATLTAAAALAALALAGPGQAQLRGHSSDTATFSVSQTPDPSCAGFFSFVAPTVDGWSGHANLSWTFADPAYTDVSVLLHGTWTDSAAGFDYRVRFSGYSAGPELQPVADGTVTIKRSDGRALTGSAQFAGDQNLLSLGSVSCS
jgi:hypothetical protein